MQNIDLRHMNILAYASNEEQTDPPRIKRELLHEFLNIPSEARTRTNELSRADQESREYYQPDMEYMTILAAPHGGSFRKILQHLVANIVHDAETLMSWVSYHPRLVQRALRNILIRIGSETETVFLNAQYIDSALADTRKLLWDHDVCAMTVGGEMDAAALAEFGEKIESFKSHDKFLFISGKTWNGEPLAFLDPFPMVHEILSRPDLWPGVLFWTHSGSFAFAPLERAIDLVKDVTEAIQGGVDSINKKIRSFKKGDSDSDIVRIIHLSDLHFGSKNASKYTAYLINHLGGIVKQNDRIIITGDLLNHPRPQYLQLYNSFLASLNYLTQGRVIVVVGNHDHRYFGNVIGAFYGLHRVVPQLDLHPLVIVDDALKCVFFRFDSAVDSAFFARGRIKDYQYIAVAADFENKCRNKPEIANYLAVALVHHHPYSDKDTAGLKHRFSTGNEKFLRFSGGKIFLKWCAARNISLVLHGHKHEQMHFVASANLEAAETSGEQEVTAIGCGSSLGQENTPCRYNVIEWSPKNKQCSVTFYEDCKPAAGFMPKYIAAQRIKL